MFDEMTDPKKMLRNAFGQFASGVTVVTLLDDQGRPTGITMNSFSSLSLDPALLLFSVGKEQVSCRWFNSCTNFVVNVLSLEQEATAWQFAKPLPDKFEGIEWHQGSTGLPVLTGCLATFECRKWEMYEGGDHMIVVGEVLDLSTRDGAPLVFHEGKMSRIATS